MGILKAIGSALTGGGIGGIGKAITGGGLVNSALKGATKNAATGGGGSLGNLAKAAGGVAAGVMGGPKDLTRRDPMDAVRNPVGYSGRRMFDKTPVSRRIGRGLTGRR